MPARALDLLHPTPPPQNQTFKRVYAALKSTFGVAGKLRFEGRVLQDSQTPLSAMDAKDLLQEADELGDEEVVVQVDFIASE